MKNLNFALLALVGFSQAQIVTIGGRTQWGDSLRWGASSDSTGYLRARGNAITRDSAGTWKTITTDSCSLPLRMGFTTTPDSKLELSYEVRTSSGNTDSSQVKLRFDSRYCRSLTDTTKCESWVPAGRFLPDTTTQIIDSLITVATASGVTWKPTRQLFDIPGGNQIRACVDGYKAGGGTGDSTFFRRFVIRNSSVPAGGTPPSSATLTGDITVSDVAVSSSALPTGAATSAKQPAPGTAGSASADVITVQGIASGTPQPVSGTVAATQSGTWTIQPGNTANTTAWKVDGSAVTQPVSLSGVATAANQSTGNTSLGTIAGAVAGSEMQVDVVTSALPALAATSTKQSDGTQKTQIVDGSGNVIASTSNNLNVQCANCSGSGASAADAASFTAGASTMAPAGAFYQTTATSNPLTNGQQGMLQATPYRAVHVNLRDAAGAEVSVGGGTQYNEDDAHASGNKLTMAGAVRRDTPASSTATDGDNATLNTNSAGRLYTSATVDAALPAGTNNIGDVDVLTLPALAAGTANIGDVDVLTVPTDPFGANADAASATGSVSAKLRFIAATGIPITSSALPTGAATEATLSAASAKLPATLGQKAMTASMAVVLASDQASIPITVATIPSHAVTNAGTFATQAAGAAANDAPASGGPVQTGGVAQTADPTVVTAGDAAYSLHTIGNKQVVMPYSLSGSRWSYAAASGGLVNTTAVTMKAAAAAGIKNCLTGIQVINGHATVSTEVLVRDGAAGTVLHRGWAQAAGGGYAYELPVPICGTAATLMEVVNVTTGSAVYVNAQGYISAE